MSRTKRPGGERSGGSRHGVWMHTPYSHSRQQIYIYKRRRAGQEGGGGGRLPSTGTAFRSAAGNGNRGETWLRRLLTRRRMSTSFGGRARSVSCVLPCVCTPSPAEALQHDLGNGRVSHKETTRLRRTSILVLHRKRQVLLAVCYPPRSLPMVPGGIVRALCMCGVGGAQQVRRLRMGPL